MSATGQIVKPRVPAELVERINEAHGHFVRAACAAIDWAIAAGEALLSAKEIVGHGSWGVWLKENCTVGERQAQRYMKLAANSEQLTAKASPKSDLTITSALALLSSDAAPEPEPEPGEQPDEGDDEPEPDRDEGDEEPEPTAVQPKKPKAMTAAAIASVQRDATKIALQEIRAAAETLRRRLIAAMSAEDSVGKHLKRELLAAGVKFDARETPAQDYESKHYYTLKDVTGIPAVDTLLGAIDSAIATAEGGAA